eukprot:UN25838
MLFHDVTHGQLLRRCPAAKREADGQALQSAKAEKTAQEAKAAQAMQAAQAELAKTATGHDWQFLQRALTSAKAAGVARHEIRDAEEALMALRQREEERCSLHRRILQAEDNERELRECVDKCVAGGFLDEAVLAQTE